jgi:polysaccharide export outer membrane protein
MRRIAMVRRMVIAGMLALGLAGGAEVSAQVTAPPAGGAAMAQTTGGVRAGSYRIQPGDLLQYRVWPNVELTGEFPVESSGLVYLPMLGAVQVGGKTLDEARSKLREMYSKMVQGSTEPVVTITAQFAFSVTGGVAQPGIFDGHAGMTVFDAISRAGGYKTEATPKYVDVVHADGTTTRLETGDGSQVATGASLTSVLMQSQDRLVVPAAHKAFTTQNLYSAVQIALGLITVIKLFGN